MTKRATMQKRAEILDDYRKNFKAIEQEFKTRIQNIREEIRNRKLADLRHIISR